MTIDCPTDRDPTRAPGGEAVVRIQATDVPFRPRGDAGGEIDVGDGTWSDALTDRFADRMLDVVERHLPGTRAAMLHRAVVTPDAIARFNPNSGPGDLYGGAASLAQNLLWRPLAAAPGVRTFVPNLYLVGAATWPGSGVNGASGHLVARLLLG
jgi:phytoene dehydrogenase-like protein